MRYCRFQLNNQTLYGNVELRASEPWIVSLAQAPQEDLAFRLHDSAASSAFEPLPLAQAQLLAPVTPTKIICIGRNYRDHVKEMQPTMPSDLPKEPLMFLKPPSAILAPGGTILSPAASSRVDYEGELAVVIGQQATRIDENDWRHYVRGYTIANDVTARDLQIADGQWTRGKGFDTFCPLGPIVTDEIDPTNVALETRVNGHIRQQGTTADLIFGLPRLIAYISACMTLMPGDLILSGTPAGIGPLLPGDRVEVSIPGIGTLANSVS